MASRGRNSGSYDAPSPLVPFFLVSTMVGMAFLPLLTSYISAVVGALQEIKGKVFLWPLLIILGISLISTVCQWMNPAPAPGSVYYPPRNRDWKGSSGNSSSAPEQQSDGSGVGLFIFLVFALVLIPWR